MWGTTSKHAILIQSSHQIFPTGIPGKKHFSYCPGGHCCPAIYIQSLQLHRCTGQGEVNHHKNLHHYFKISSLIKDNSCSILLLPLSFLQPGLMNPSTCWTFQPFCWHVLNRQEMFNNATQLDNTASQEQDKRKTNNLFDKDCQCSKIGYTDFSYSWPKKKKLFQTEKPQYSRGKCLVVPDIFRKAHTCGAMGHFETSNKKVLTFLQK